MKAALFDAGDTLVHQWVDKRDRFCWLCQHAGLDVPDDAERQRAAARAAERFFQRRQSHPDRNGLRFWQEYFTIGLAELGLPADTVPRVLEVSRSLERREWLDPEAIPLLQALRARGYKIGLVSNWDGTLADCCEQAGLTPYIDFVGDSTVVDLWKPNPAFFHHALSELGVAPADAFHVGDSYGADVVGALAAGVTPILLDSLGCEEQPVTHRIARLSEVLDLCEKL